MRDILASLDRENVGWKMVYNFLGNDGKTWRNLYLLSLKTSLSKRSRTFFRAVYPNKNHVTTTLLVQISACSMQEVVLILVLLCLIMRYGYDIPVVIEMIK